MSVDEQAVQLALVYISKQDLGDDVNAWGEKFKDAKYRIRCILEGI